MKFGVFYIVGDFPFIETTIEDLVEETEKTLGEKELIQWVNMEN